MLTEWHRLRDSSSQLFCGDRLGETIVQGHICNPVVPRQQYRLAAQGGYQVTHRGVRKDDLLGVDRHIQPPGELICLPALLHATSIGDKAHREAPLLH